jgi:tRNA/tmRNA/rRNA uracil-C5-methylase (TrmA/RlmC/RlmD family)
VPPGAADSTCWIRRGLVLTEAMASVVRSARIIYVSCDPRRWRATRGVSRRRLSLASLREFDLFNTPHVETIGF